MGAGTDEQIVQRGHGSKHGIGLSLLADAEGGRVTVANCEPTTLTLVFLAADDT